MAINFINCGESTDGPCAPCCNLPAIPLVDNVTTPTLTKYPINVSVDLTAIAYAVDTFFGADAGPLFQPCTCCAEMSLAFLCQLASSSPTSALWRWTDSVEDALVAYAVGTASAARTAAATLEACYGPALSTLDGGTCGSHGSTTPCTIEVEYNGVDATATLELRVASFDYHTSGVATAHYTGTPTPTKKWNSSCWPGTTGLPRVWAVPSGAITMTDAFGPNTGFQRFEAADTVPGFGFLGGAAYCLPPVTVDITFQDFVTRKLVPSDGSITTT